jgi:hypothetical protein
LPSFARPGVRLPSVDDADVGLPLARSVLGAGVDDEVIVHVWLAELLPPDPVAVATNVWLPVVSALNDVGLVHVDALPPSSLHETEVAFVVDQAKEADVDVVDDGGVCVKLIVGAGVVGVDAVIDQLYEVDALPPAPVAVATKVWLPVARELNDVGLVQEDALPPSSLHETEVAFAVDQAKVAPVAVVEEAGFCVRLIVGAGAGGGAGAVIVQLTLATAFDFCWAEIANVWLPTERFE